MDKLIKSFLLFSFLLTLGLSFPQGLYGQETILSEGTSLIVEDDIFGGVYEYISGETIVSDRIISDGADVSYKAMNSIKLTTGFKVEKNCHFKARLIEVQKQPFTVHDLKITGDEVMKELNLKPSPEVGKILNQLFEEVVEKKLPNEKKALLERMEPMNIVAIK